MLSFLKDHPFAVEAWFERSLVLSFAFPASTIASLLPECLEPDTYNNKWGFITAAFVKTKHLRPKGFPRFMGNDFMLAGYRVFVRYQTSEGKNLRGLFILRSETDKARMAFMGNLFTHYNYHQKNIHFLEQGSIIEVHSNTGLKIKVNTHSDPSLPQNSPFPDWKTARRFAGPLPFTFTQEGNKVLIIEGVRKNWNPQPVEVMEWNIPFLQENNLPEPMLANCFLVEDIPYYWKKGKKDLWKQPL